MKQDGMYYKVTQEYHHLHREKIELMQQRDKIDERLRVLEDVLYPDSVSIKGDRLCISQSQIANAPTVNVLDKIRAEIEDLRFGQPLRKLVVDECLEIIDKYKAEARDKE